MSALRAFGIGSFQRLRVRKISFNDFMYLNIIYTEDLVNYVNLIN